MSTTSSSSGFLAAVAPAVNVAVRRKVPETAETSVAVNPKNL